MIRAALLARIRAVAAALGRHPRFSLSLRPVLADTEEQAWAKADAIVENAEALRAADGSGRKTNAVGKRADGAPPPNEGSRPLLAAAAQGVRLGKQL